MVKGAFFPPSQFWTLEKACCIRQKIAHCGHCQTFFIFHSFYQRRTQIRIVSLLQKDQDTWYTCSSQRTQMFCVLICAISEGCLPSRLVLWSFWKRSTPPLPPHPWVFFTKRKREGQTIGSVWSIFPHSYHGKKEKRESNGLCSPSLLLACNGNKTGTVSHLGKPSRFERWSEDR